MTEVKIDKIIRSKRRTIALEVARDATLTIREQTEEIEKQVLHPKACLSSQSKGRLKPEREDAEIKDCLLKVGLKGIEDRLIDDMVLIEADK